MQHCFGLCTLSWLLSWLQKSFSIVILRGTFIITAYHQLPIFLNKINTIKNLRIQIPVPRSFFFLFLFVCLFICFIYLFILCIAQLDIHKVMYFINYYRLMLTRGLDELAEQELGE